MSWLSKWEPKDVIALVALVIMGVLMGLGHNSALVTLFALLIAAYVGIDISLLRRRRK